MVERAQFLRDRIFDLVTKHGSLTPRECAKLLDMEAGRVGHCMNRMKPEFLTTAGRGRYQLAQGATRPSDGRGEVKSSAERRQAFKERMSTPISWQFGRIELEIFWPFPAYGNLDKTGVE